MDGGEASGFPCPGCGCTEADVDRVTLPQVELRCKACSLPFCVEC